MVFNRFSRSVIFSIGLGWGLLSGFVFSRTSTLSEWEQEVYSWVMTLRRSPDIPKDILLIQPQLEPVNDPDAFTHPEGLRLDQFNHILEQLVPLLINEHHVQMVVLNPPKEWPATGRLRSKRVSTAGGSHAPQPIQQSIERYQRHLVLATPVSLQQGRLGSEQLPEIDNYGALLPFQFSFETNVLQPKFAPQVIQGFWEDKSQLPSQIWRTTPLAGRFAVEQSGETQVFQSMALLACQKLARRADQGAHVCRQQAHLPQNLFKPVWIPLLGPSGSFSSLDLQLPSQCPSQTCDRKGARRLGNLAGKVVLIDGADTSVKTPLGAMSRLELQANVLASLIEGSFAQEAMLLWPAITPALVILAALCLDLAIIWGIEVHGRELMSTLWISLPVFWGGYALWFILVGWGLGILLPLVLPLSIWMGTGMATVFCALSWQRELHLNHKVRELARLRGETQEQALVLKTQTLLRRIASDVHGGPLQELKVAMFQVEGLQREHPHLDVTPILNGLVYVGQSVRAQLNNIQDLAAKLRMTPQLRNGLDVGIRWHLQQMMESGRLQLTVNQSLQALEEPDLNTVWIAAREDIFRFFCEAINNVVYHAQPPRGDASWVTVSLSQTGLHCRLAIANDGSSPPELDLADIGVSQGTKTMVEIARDLPGGEWCRFPLASGGLCVELSWLMQFYPGETDP